MVICRRGRSSRVLSSVRDVIFGDWYTEWTTSRPFCGPFSRWQLRLYLFLVRCLLFCFFPLLVRFFSYLEAPLPSSPVQPLHASWVQPATEPSSKSWTPGDPSLGILVAWCHIGDDPRWILSSA
ncbi:hypothetical protein CABS01_04494 [Colletotrichum abscissum]|uniref:uncharacterized protein n=1 Tax=Colletotrichum abscissum TaxID=1671311 RepID=UPI0027D5C3F3|nr:uncharacterized protein CABS01_04494 [Colletotrichum abscissum]KAK1473832.1 hypothetical protein CABS01_04494 [Colletotrichum abscissum]